ARHAEAKHAVPQIASAPAKHAKHAVLHVEPTPAKAVAAAVVAPPAPKLVKQADKHHGAQCDEGHASPDKEHKRKHHHRSHRHNTPRHTRPRPRPHTDANTSISPGRKMAPPPSPNVPPPSRIAPLARRAVRVGLFFCLLGVIGAAGTGGYFLFVKYGVIGGR